jgi:hypothetical protein
MVSFAYVHARLTWRVGADTYLVHAAADFTAGMVCMQLTVTCCEMQVTVTCRDSRCHPGPGLAGFASLCCS